MANLCIRYRQRGGNHKALAMTSSVPEFKRTLLAELIKETPSLQSKTLPEVNELVFRNASILRLTYSGYVIMRGQFAAYSFEIARPMKSRTLAALSKLAFPYFITSGRLVVFSEMDAAMITLAGDVETFLENNL